MKTKRFWISAFLAIWVILPVSVGVRAQDPESELFLTISGSVKGTGQLNEVRLSMAQLGKLPQVTFTTKTPWHPDAVTMTGPLLRDVLKLAEASGTKLVAVALNDYKVEIPMDDAQNHRMIVAILMNGKPMPVRAKGPFFIIYPFDSLPELQSQKYYFRSAWQLSQIIVK